MTVEEADLLKLYKAEHALKAKAKSLSKAKNNKRVDKN